MTDREILEKLLTKIESLEQEISGLKSQTTENTELIRALIDSGETHKAILDNITYKLSEISGEIASIKSSTTTLEMVSAKNMMDIARLKNDKI